MTCKYCNSEEVNAIIYDESKCSPHYGEERCNRCGRHIKFIKKPENANKRSDKNTHWRDRWKDKGEFICALCGIRESDGLNVRFQCDHIRQIEDGGADEFENTMMLCDSCHTNKTSRWNNTKRWRMKAKNDKTPTLYKESGFNA